MKSTGSLKKFPASQAEVAAAIALVPGKDRPLTAPEEAQWSAGVMMVNGGGCEAARKALAAKRRPGQRGPQVAPTKQLVSVRYSPDVLAFFKASGAGWQSRMDDALKQWVAAQTKTKRRIPSEA